LVVNAAKHAYQDSAGEVRIDLAHSAKGWRLTVADDGPGFRVPTRSSPDHIGWAIIRQLAVSLQGKVRVKNGHGATVSVVFPEPSSSNRGADGHPLI
jgi:two-component sensor histidine kinase